MKKFTLFALSIFAVSLVQAQFVKGDRYLGGTMSAHYNDEDINTNDALSSFGVNLSPSITKFRSEKKARGFKVSAGYGENKSFSNGFIQNTKNYGIGAGVFTLNILSLGKGFFLSLEKGVGAGYNWGNSKNNQVPSATTKFSEYGIGVYLTPGLGYKLTNRLIVGVNLNSIINLSYNHRKTEHDLNGIITAHKTDRVNIYSSLNNTTVGQLGFSFAWKLK